MSARRTHLPRTGRGNLQEFTDPVQYDIEELPSAQTRIDCLLALAREQGPRVVDLACGTGLATLPLALAGHVCTGVDLSESMLAHARTKAWALRVASRCHWVLADIRQVAPRQLADTVVLTGNAFQAMLTERDQRRLLANVARHLREDGLFVFETRNPSGHDLRDVSRWEPWFECVSARGETVQVGGTQQWIARRRVLIWTTERRWLDRDTGAPMERRTRIACRFTDRRLLGLLLADAGLRVVAQYGDWDQSPHGPSSPLIVTVCRKARTARAFTRHRIGATTRRRHLAHR